MTGARMVIEAAEPLPGPVQVPVTANPLGDRVLLLTRDAGFAEVALIDFAYETGPTLFGSREELLAEWRAKLALEPAFPSPQAMTLP